METGWSSGVGCALLVGFAVFVPDAPLPLIVGTDQHVEGEILAGVGFQALRRYHDFTIGLLLVGNPGVRVLHMVAALDGQTDAVDLLQPVAGQQDILLTAILLMTHVAN